MSKSPRPMSDAPKSPKGPSLHVKVCSVRNIGKYASSPAQVVVKYGADARQTRQSKRSTWDEDTAFAFGDEKTVEIILQVASGLLGGKKTLGEAKISLADLKPGITSNWYPLSKKDKPKGEIQITIDLPKPAAKKVSLKETEQLLAATGGIDFSAKPAPEINLAAEYDNLAVGKARIVVDATDVDISFDNVTCGLERGSLVFTFSKDDVSVSARFPKPTDATNTNEFKKSPTTGVTLTHPKLALKPAFAVTIQLKNTPENTIGAYFFARAISSEHSNARKIKGIFKVDKSIVEQAIKGDDLSSFETAAEHIPSEVATAAFKADIATLEKALERGEDVNEVDENGESALHKAVARGHEEVIKILVEAGADPRLTNKYGQSAADLGSKFRPELVPLLHKYL